ncbi:cell division protein SepF 2 [Acidimicrobiaceae bacterium]|nr:cell division protein SepF 2 [Acidimicrobiaceae bacterium]
MSLFQKAMDYLGLGDDGSYDEYDDEMPEDPYPENRRGGEDDVRGAQGAFKRGRVNDFDTSEELRSEDETRRVRERDDSGVTIRPTVGRRNDASVRTISHSTTPITVQPQTYEEVTGIVDHFRKGTPVIMDLQNTDARIMRRIVDFASGVCYAQGGAIEKVSSGVFMMKPSGARVIRG